MIIRRRPALRWIAAAASLVLGPAAWAQDESAADIPPLFQWRTVANSADLVPGTTRAFNSFGAPSVNRAGTVVFRGRSRSGAGAGEPVRGVYARGMGVRPQALWTVFDNATTVPDPNNTVYNGQPSTFTEFPAFARIGIDSATIVTRGQSRPVWTYVLADGTETRVGTSGIYGAAQDGVATAMGQLGAVPGFEHFAVPGASPGVRFDQFPGAPTVAGQGTVVFKGNYTDGEPRTGVFYRQFLPQATSLATVLIANSQTLIPGQPEGGVRFGSTAPPSAGPSDMVFLGVDNEASPTLGGIYQAPLSPRARLTPLVTIGSQVPGESSGTAFTRIGEALSYDGRFVAFWGAWGTQARTITLTCPAEGQAAVVAYCLQQHPAGFVTTVPENQGFFVHDRATGRTVAAARTGAEFVDFLYWTYSGRPPGVGDQESEDFEAPRWRASAFAAAYGRGARAQLAFKARRPTVPAIDGIYLTVAGEQPAVVRTVVDTQTGGAQLDPLAPGGSRIVALGIERDGLRNGWLTLNASMLDETTGEAWAGVYLTRSRLR